MRQWINENPMTFLLYIIFLIIALPGGWLVITGELTYEEYTIRLVALGGAIGLFGAGKAIKNGLLGSPPAKASEDGLPPADPPAMTVASTAAAVEGDGEEKLPAGVPEDEYDPDAAIELPPPSIEDRGEVYVERGAELDDDDLTPDEALTLGEESFGLPDGFDPRHEERDIHEADTDLRGGR